MSRPAPILPAAADARSSLPETDAVAFDRLVHALLASPSAPLGPLLRSCLPGTAGVRWLHREELSPTARPTALTADQWLSLFSTWTAVQPAPEGRARGGRSRGGRPSTHGHAPGATAIPRWGQ
ncbi:hypothetical protein DQ237_03610 [Blastococcus sp. TF02-8]|uniref:hypothetical protein n=1 Tax=Blastococcus sp. TF02-8 TaxID=2250574 RepID=UPI000DEB7ABB|nr:hypothetical protein [Blastococcus sp. TF02-8]RBY97992.1 hypothetical protein DQ237_03610 [Blastococcus sp. TF02-8]